MANFVLVSVFTVLDLILILFVCARGISIENISLVNSKICYVLGQQ